jgi:hypothetical protein
LSSIERRIVALVDELTALISEFVEENDEDSPLGEFDQRVLLEHAQIIERYVLAQAAARAFPDRYRLIGQPAPGWSGVTADVDASDSSHAHPVGRGPHTEHDHDEDHGHLHDESSDHAHGPGSHQHHVADKDAAREAHRSGRAIIGEHPWEQEHAHDDGHDHADEWEWEPITERTDIDHEPSAG